MAAKDDQGGLMSAAGLKQVLKQAKNKGKPASCVIAFTKDKQGVILVDRRRRPRKLMGEAVAKGT